MDISYQAVIAAIAGLWNEEDPLAFEEYARGQVELISELGLLPHPSGDLDVDRDRIRLDVIGHKDVQVVREWIRDAEWTTTLGDIRMQAWQVLRPDAGTPRAVVDAANRILNRPVFENI